jgi:type IV secretion system protein VirB10
MNTRAAFHGDQLVVTTTGNAGNDFTVTFEPIDDGRNLRVTRSIYDDGLRQPVTIRSFYRRSSDEAQWDLYARTGVPSSRGPTTGNFLVPGGTRVVVTLDEALSTGSARQGDRLSMTTRNPSRYDGAVIEAFVSSVNASEPLSGRADLALSFESIRLLDGRTYQFTGVIENVRMPDGEAIRVDREGTVEDENSQTEKTVQRGAIGAAVGAIIGAAAGGGKLAAIGAVIGAGGGAGTVIVEGRDQLDLPRGTELTIISSTPRAQSERTGAQR